MNSAQRRSGSEFVWNFLTLVLIAGVIVVILFVGMVCGNPHSALNPFPPPTVVADAPLLSSTAPAATDTTAPTATLLPTALPATATPQPTATLPPTPEPTATEPAGGYAFAVKSEVVALDGTIFHADWGCRWLGLAGQVEDLQGRPVTGIRVAAGGQVNGSPLEMTSMTGTALQYGPAGYEFKLADAPFASNGVFWVQLIDQAGLPLSRQVVFDTRSECDKNLILVNFEQVR